jgi:dTDP-4-amino-4,6-dideoxygalactose transaminase
VDSAEYGLSRDELYVLLRDFNVFARKYFFPLVSHAPCYADLPTARPDLLPVAERIASQVLCLPVYATMLPETAAIIAQVIRMLPTAR